MAAASCEEDEEIEIVPHIEDFSVRLPTVMSTIFFL